DFQLLRLKRVGLIGKPQMNENAIVTVNLRRSQRFTIHWDKPFADLACAFSNELFQPCAQIVNSLRGNDGDFVPAKGSQRSQNCAKDRTGILVCWDIRLTSLDHFIGTLKEFVEIESHDGGRGH